MEFECYVRVFGFYFESNGELLEDFKYENNRIRFIFGEDYFGSNVNQIERDEVGGREIQEVVLIV